MFVCVEVCCGQAPDQVEGGGPHALGVVHDEHGVRGLVCVMALEQGHHLVEHVAGVAPHRQPQAAAQRA